MWYILHKTHVNDDDGIIIIDDDGVVDNDDSIVAADDNDGIVAINNDDAIVIVDDVGTGAGAAFTSNGDACDTGIYL